jgi:replicative DNA helicase
MTDREFYSREGFQDEILATMCRNPEQMRQLESVIEPVYFTGLHAAIVATKVKDFFAEYRNYPTFEELRQFIEDKLGPDEQEKAREVNEYVDKLEVIEVRSPKYIRDHTAHWCRESAIINAVHRSVNALKAGRSEWPKEGFASWFDEAMRVGQQFENMGYSFFDDAEAVIDKVTAENYGIRSGYKMLDQNWINGWGPGWLVVPLAPPKSYKSTFCANLALNMTEGGSNPDPVDVLYYPCEISDELTLARCYCAVTGLSMYQLYRETGKFKTALRQELGDRWGRRGGGMWVKSFGSKEATIADIRTHALSVIDMYGIQPKAIFIDHAETVRASRRSERASDWRQQADIYAEARALGAELGATTIMPDRCNRETVDRAVPNMKSFQGSFEKAGVVDVAIGLCQDEQERAEGTKKKATTMPLRYFIFLNRHGESCGYYSGYVEKKSYRMEILEPLSYEEALKVEEESKRGSRSKDRKPGHRMLADAGATD